MNNAPDKEEMKNLYGKGYSMKEIGELLGFSTGKIHKYFHIYNITPREKGVQSERAKRKLSNSLKNIVHHKGHKQSEETRLKMSIAKTKKGIGHKKKRADGYISIYFPDHPKSNKDGYIMEHDLIMECYLGRWLKDDEIVHHRNKIRSDNRIENLELMTFKDHARLHALERHRKGVMTY